MQQLYKYPYVVFRRQLLYLLTFLIHINNVIFEFQLALTGVLQILISHN